MKDSELEMSLLSCPAGRGKTGSGNKTDINIILYLTCLVH